MITSRETRYSFSISNEHSYDSYLIEWCAFQSFIHLFDHFVAFEWLFKRDSSDLLSGVLISTSYNITWGLIQLRVARCFHRMIRDGYRSLWSETIHWAFIARHDMKMIETNRSSNRAFGRFDQNEFSHLRTWRLILIWIMLIILTLFTLNNEHTITSITTQQNRSLIHKQRTNRR